jgi:predicted aspartyl protease
MLYRFLATVTIGLAVFGPAAAASAEERPPSAPGRPPAPPAITELAGSVRVPAVRMAHMIGVRARVNGRGPYRFVIDTGSAAPLRVSQRLADALDLETIGTVRTSDPSGRNPLSVRLVRVGSVQIGAARLSGIEASVGTRLGTLEPDGIVGLSFFSPLTVTLDFPKHELRLSRTPLPDGGAHIVGFTRNRGVPQIGVDVAGIKLRVDIDSGSPAFLTVPSSTHVPLRGEPRVVGTGRSAGGVFPIREAEIVGEVSIVGWAHKNPTIHIVDAFPVASLGSQLLGRYAVTFDLRNGRVALMTRGQGG